MRSTHADTHPLTYKAHAVLKPLPVHIPDLLYVCDVKPGRLIRERRLANGLTQAQIALRAGSTQESISRLERDEISPTFETVERLLGVMGEELAPRVRRAPLEADRRRLRALRGRPPAERLELALSWNRFAGEVARAGARARSENV